MASHLVLLGDSIFDNRSYTRGAPDVVTHLRDILPTPWRATLCAVDGHTTRELARQLSGVPADASHVVVSIGGNDALMNSDLLNKRVGSTAEALALFARRIHAFEVSYRSALDSVLALGRPTTTCTIYNGNLDASEAPIARVALMMFNDVILRYAIEHQLAVIDLRMVCNETADYANPIEPSGTGGRKIASAIANSIVAEHRHASVYWR
ncbi:MAG: SGNH/GDSL hydrolase family protein [Gemmatimonadota bacterium]